MGDHETGARRAIFSRSAARSGAWQVCERDHNLPPEGEPYQPPVDYVANTKSCGASNDRGVNHTLSNSSPEAQVGPPSAGVVASGVLGEGKTKGSSSR
jgi:hypothetical protein